MSVIKFGNRKLQDGSTDALRYNTFLWGQPNRFYLLENLLEYLPLYIVRNKLCMSILKSIAILLLRWDYKAGSLKALKVTGKTGIKYANENWKLFIRDDSGGAETEDNIRKTYTIHSARGTEEGMLRDMKKITYNESTWFKFYGHDNCGWWLDSSYPDLSTDGYAYKLNKLTYLGLENMLFVEYYNRSRKPSEFIQRLMLREAIPLTLNTTFVELKPYVIKFGQFRFSTLRTFGEIRSPQQFLIGS